MKLRTFFSVMLILGFVQVSPGISAAQEEQLTDYERQVYYDIADMSYRIGGEKGWEGVNDEQYGRIYETIAAKYGITYSQVYNIGQKGYKAPLTQREWQIWDDLDAGLIALPQGYSKQDVDRVYQEVADRWGISIYVLQDIDNKAFYEEGWFW